MRKLMLMAALTLALPVSAAAQDGPRTLGGRAPMLNTTEWLLKSKDEYKASAEQVAKIEEIAKKFNSDTEKQREEFEKVRGEMRDGGDRQTMMQKMRPIREEIQKKDEAAVAEVMLLLNDEQKKQVKELLEARKEQMQQRRRSPGAGIQRQ